MEEEEGNAEEEEEGEAPTLRGALVARRRALPQILDFTRSVLGF